MQFYALGVPGEGDILDVYVAVGDADDVTRITKLQAHCDPEEAMVMRIVEAVIIESLIHMQRCAGMVPILLSAHFATLQTVCTSRSLA